MSAIPNSNCAICIDGHILLSVEYTGGDMATFSLGTAIPAGGLKASRSEAVRSLRALAEWLENPPRSKTKSPFCQ